MSVGFLLRGKVSKPAQLLPSIQAIAAKRYGNDLLSSDLSEDESSPVLWLRTHPAAEDLEFRTETTEAGETMLTVSTSTSCVGPGYHADLCELCDELTVEHEIAWEYSDPADDDSDGVGDDTGYFFHRDREELEAHMLGWLHTVATVLAEHIETGHDSLRLSMPMEPHFHGPPDAALLTQTGPRSKAWLQRVIDDPINGRDLFAWWNPGRGAHYELSRVMVHCWLDVRWHPAETEEEKELGLELLARLRRAYELDPTLAYPWREWEELHDVVVDADEDDLSGLVRENADRGAQSEQLIGYRHYPIDWVVDQQWRLTIPGNFSVKCDDDGNWLLWDGLQVLQLNTMYFTGTGDLMESLDASIAKGPARTAVTLNNRSDPPLRYRAHSSSFQGDDGLEHQSLTVTFVSDDGLLLLTASSPVGDSMDWAMALFESVELLPPETTASETSD